MSALAITLLDNAQESLGGFLPRLGGALLLLLVGLLVAALVGRLAGGHSRPRAPTTWATAGAWGTMDEPASAAPSPG